MKIISKYKDYYDYMIAKYGYDNLIVYDRRGIILSDDDVTLMNPNECEYRMFLICGNTFTIFYYKRKIYHTPEEIVQLHNLLKKYSKQSPLDDKFIYDNNFRKLSVKARAQAVFNDFNKPTKINKKMKAPVLMLKGDEYVIVPLKRYGVPKYISPDDMFSEIYSFLSKLKDVCIPNNQTDGEKILSHGFDEKISFRHRTK